MQNRAQLETRLETARALAKAYFEVVAEGVDTARRHDFLRAKGCDFAQGFWFSPSVSRARFEQLLVGSPLVPDD